MNPVAGPLVEVGLRDNPLRAHLLVSTVLGKHVPVPPAAVRESVVALAGRARDLWADADAPTVCVVGFAETATGLSERLADVLDAERVIVTTRYRAGRTPVESLREDHSHAPVHWLLAPVVPPTTQVAVIVDDEVTTGRTVEAMAALVQAAAPGAQVIVACLVDALSEKDRERLAARVDALVSLERMPTRVIEDALGRAPRAQGVPTHAAVASAEPRTPAAPVSSIDVMLPPGTSATSRYGWGAREREAIRACAHRIGELVAPHVAPDCIVLGTEELLWLPQLVAENLQERGHHVRTGSTTRSPALIIDVPGYPLRSARRWFVDGWDAPRFTYNTVGAKSASLVFVVDDAFDEDTDAYVSALTSAFEGDAQSLVVVRLRRGAESGAVPSLRGPAFSTYAPDEVGWLLSDVSGWGLERPMSEREPDIQAGRAHYSESLSVEYRPTAEYLDVYDRALARNSGAVASGVRTLAEALLRQEHAPVLVSLVRAGVPIAVLLRDALAAAGVFAPHYAMSVVRDRGVDERALDAIVAAHGDRGIRFVDGWTGKGTIADEMRGSIARYNATRGTTIDAGLWVISDPLGVAGAAATNEDFLIPSACLNATVTGLISRSVRTDRTLREAGYDGAAFYRELAPVDRSREFLAAVRTHLSSSAKALPSWRPSPEGAARATIAGLLQRFDIAGQSRLKPGVGETTRVLLRRPAREIHVRRDAGDDVAHVRRLAADRGVPVHEVDDLPFLAIGVVDGRGE